MTARFLFGSMFVGLISLIGGCRHGGINTAQHSFGSAAFGPHMTAYGEGAHAADPFLENGPSPAANNSTADTGRIHLSGTDQHGWKRAESNTSPTVVQQFHNAPGTYTPSVPHDGAGNWQPSQSTGAPFPQTSPF